MALNEFFSTVINVYIEKKFETNPHLTASLIETPLGPMIAIGDENFLYLLEFMDCRSLEREVKRLVQKTKRTILPGSTQSILSIKKELSLFFKGELKAFNTPIYLVGTSFQQQVWKELLKIPFGETRSYAAIAKALGKPTAFRAVALANSSNQLPLIIPCHRVIKSNGALCGYNGGVSRKQWLLDHEKAFYSNTSTSNSR